MVVTVVTKKTFFTKFFFHKKKIYQKKTLQKKLPNKFHQKKFFTKHLFSNKKKIPPKNFFHQNFIQPISSQKKSRNLFTQKKHAKFFCTKKPLLSLEFYTASPQSGGDSSDSVATSTSLAQRPLVSGRRNSIAMLRSHRQCQILL